MVPPEQTVRATSSIRFTVNATHPDLGELIIITASGLPQGAMFAPDTGVISWTPSLNQTGTYTVTFTAMDSGNPPMSNSKFDSIQVQPAANGGPSGGSTNTSGGCSLCKFFLKKPQALGF